jgi:tRNA uridine 5-carbamoylmethylation protein Kti12
MTIIMLCGQGSSGKSTFASFLRSQLPNEQTALVAMDKILKPGEHLTESNLDYYWNLYFHSIQVCLENGFKYIILDMSNDAVAFRQKTFQSINFNLQNINLITISLRPGVENLLSWHDIRCGELKSAEKGRIITAYNKYEFPIKQEFTEFNFKSVKVLVVNNSDINEMKNIMQEIIE